MSHKLKYINRDVTCALKPQCLALRACILSGPREHMSASGSKHQPWYVICLLVLTWTWLPGSFFLRGFSESNFCLSQIVTSVSEYMRKWTYMGEGYFSSGSEAFIQVTWFGYYSDSEARLSPEEGVSNAHFITAGDQRVGGKDWGQRIPSKSEVQQFTLSSE